MCYYVILSCAYRHCFVTMYIAATSDDIKLTLQSLDKMIRKRREVCIKVCVFIVWTGFNAIIIVCLFVCE